MSRKRSARHQIVDVALKVRSFAALKVRSSAALKVRSFAALKVRSFAALKVRSSAALKVRSSAALLFCIRTYRIDGPFRVSNAVEDERQYVRMPQQAKSSRNCARECLNHS